MNRLPVVEIDRKAEPGAALDRLNDKRIREKLMDCHPDPYCYKCNGSGEIVDGFTGKRSLCRCVKDKVDAVIAMRKRETTEN